MVVVDEGGITPAANFLGLKQPTVSAALKRLEDSLERKLINRSPSHFSVTPLGQVLYSEARSIFGTVAQVPDLMSGLDEEVTGHVSIALASHVVTEHFDDALAKFNAQHPQVTYSFSTLESAEVAALVGQNSMTMGICLLQDQPPHLETRVLYREFFGFYCGPRHRLFGKPDIRLSDLKDEHAVSFQTDEIDGPLFKVAKLRMQAGMNKRLKGISSNLPEVRRMIISNIGIGALPVHIAQQDVREGRLWQLPPYSALPAVDIFLLTNPKRTLNKAEAILLDLLQATLKQVPLMERTYS